jgi:hypothetical protein
MKRHWVVAAVLASVLVLHLSCSSKPDFRPNPAYHSTRFPETRSMSEAKLWLYWSSSERLSFVRGFVVAYRDGMLRGCRFAFEAFEHASGTSSAGKQILDSATCYQQKLQFDRDMEYYEHSVTAFYKAYPEDDDVPIRLLLEELAAHKNPADIHGALSPRG